MTDLKQQIRCAIYTRKSTEDGLEQDFNSLDAQREAAQSYIASQKHAGWVCLEEKYDDGGFSGGNTDRPAFQQLLEDVRDDKVDCIVVYKIDRLSRSLLDFAKIMEVLENNEVSLVSVTQQLNSSTSMGRLTLNVLLSFAQFEREIISERTRDKIAAAKRKGKWCGGHQLLGYDQKRDTGSVRIVPNIKEAKTIKLIFQTYLNSGSLMETLRHLRANNILTKRYQTRKGHWRGGKDFDKSTLRKLLTNVVYIGKVTYKDQVYDGEHDAIIDDDLFGRVGGMLSRNRGSGGKFSRNKHGALLKGIVRCKSCGCGMSHHYSSKGNKKYRYYVCVKAQKQGWDVCPGPSLPAGELESFVVESIKTIGKDPAVLSDCIQGAINLMNDKIAVLKDKRETLNDKTRSIGKEIGKVASEAGYNNGSTEKMDQLQTELSKTQKQINQINQEIVVIEERIKNSGELTGAIESFDPLWKSMTPINREKLIHLLVKQVEYNGATDTISITFHTTNIKMKDNNNE